MLPLWVYTVWSFDSLSGIFGTTIECVGTNRNFVRIMISLSQGGVGGTVTSQKRQHFTNTTENDHSCPYRFDRAFDCCSVGSVQIYCIISFQTHSILLFWEQIPEVCRTTESSAANLSGCARVPYLSSKPREPEIRLKVAGAMAYYRTMKRHM